MRAPSTRNRLIAASTVFVLLMAGAGVLLWFYGPDWSQFGSAFHSVLWGWVGVAIALNLLSIIARGLAWKTVIDQAIEPPRPGYRAVISAFSVGLFANAVLPGRIGEVARVAVLTRRAGKRKGVWATLLGTVFAHRVFDLFPVLGLLEDEPRRRRMGEAAREIASERYDWRDIAKRLLSIYELAIEGRFDSNAAAKS